jgi:hypothetical protein
LKKFIEMMDFVEGEIFREKAFREKVEAADWKVYGGNTILIKGCSRVEVPTWAYMVVTAKLVQAGAKVTFGEFTQQIPIS